MNVKIKLKFLSLKQAWRFKYNLPKNTFIH